MHEPRRPESGKKRDALAPRLLRQLSPASRLPRHEASLRRQIGVAATGHSVRRRIAGVPQVRQASQQFLENDPEFHARTGAPGSASPWRWTTADRYQ